MKESLVRVVYRLLVDCLHQSVRTSLTLFKITIPISILTKLLTEFGLINELGAALGPVMELVGLPGSMGLVWATAMVTHLYGGMIVFASLAPDANLTVAQVTILTTMMLVAHALPVELRIAQKAGTRFRVMASLRLAGAFTLGWLLFQYYRITDTLQTANRSIWTPPQQDPSWMVWFLNEVRNLFSIFLIILCLLFIMRILEKIGIISLMTSLLKPLLSLLGISKEAAPLTIIGMTLGISYGGGLIIQEAQTGKLTKQDVFYSMALMGLCHSVFEDTMLMMVLGGHLSGVLWARLVFALLSIALLVRLSRRIPTTIFNRYMLRP